MIVLSVLMLEHQRAGLQISSYSVGTTPVTLYQLPDQTGPVVVVAHGFAGSRQIMQAYSLHLAQAGYRVLAFDFEGHGRNPVPMSGDITSVNGTTQLLVAETRRVIAAGRALPGAQKIALLGHSMATDIIVRASNAEAAAGTPIDAVVAISMFSQAVTATEPKHMLVISGEWESLLRKSALDAVQLVDPKAVENGTAVAGDVTRGSFVAPRVEHVGVLFSPSAVNAAEDWLDSRFGRHGAGAAGHMGWWVLALLAGIVLGFRPLVAALPEGPKVPEVPIRRFLLATLLPTVAVPLVITPFYHNFMPVLVADYLMLHLALFGILQLTLSGGWRQWRSAFPATAVLVLAFWGIVVFGLALDRYAASFWPSAQRLPIIAALCLGTIPFMMADAYVTHAGRGALWRRVAARILLFVSLGIAAFIDPDQLTFVVIVLPVFVLFFLVHGLMGRWIGQRSGALAAGLGLGLCLAWALGVSFPLFAHARPGQDGPEKETLMEQRTALIAGGAGGMGFAIAQRLGRDGFMLAIADLPGPRLEDAAARLRVEGYGALALPLDIRTPVSCREVVTAALAWSGGLQALINAAGVWVEGTPDSMTESEWDDTLDINLKGPFFLIQAALPHLGDGASIVNIASDAGLVGNKGASIYCASKGGLVLLTKALALDLAPRGIRVNAICPGDVATAMIDGQANRYGNGDPEAYKSALLAHYPQGPRARFIRPEEIARLVSYLCEDAATPITGAALSMDFGVTAGY